MIVFSSLVSGRSGITVSDKRLDDNSISGLVNVLEPGVADLHVRPFGKRALPLASEPHTQSQCTICVGAAVDVRIAVGGYTLMSSGQKKRLTLSRRRDAVDSWEQVATAASAGQLLFCYCSACST